MLRARVEHKRDKKAGRTGNIAIEMAVRKHGETEDSGINITTAERYAIEYAPECWLVVPTEYAKRLARMAAKSGLADWIGDGGNHYNALVPIEWFVRPLKDSEK